MNNIRGYKNNYGEEVGKISVSIYRDKQSGLSSFYIDTDNDNVEQISYIIEDTLKMIWTKADIKMSKGTRNIYTFWHFSLFYIFRLIYMLYLYIHGGEKYEVKPWLY